MNFGITKVKFWTSLVLGLASGGLFLATEPRCFDCSREMYLEFIKQSFAIFAIATFIPIYLIWSFFDKKSSSKTEKIIGYTVTTISVLIILAVVGLAIIQQVRY